MQAISVRKSVSQRWLLAFLLCLLLASAAVILAAARLSAGPQSGGRVDSPPAAVQAAPAFSTPVGPAVNDNGIAIVMEDFPNGLGSRDGSDARITHGSVP